MDDIDYVLINTRELRERVIKRVGTSYRDKVESMTGEEIISEFLKVSGRKLDELIDDSIFELSNSILRRH